METAEEKDNSETTESNVQEEGKSMETSESAAQGTSDKDATKVESETNEVPDEPKQSAETQEKVDSKKGSPKTDEGGVADEAKAAKGEEMGEDQKVTAAGSSEDTAGLEAVETEGGAEQQGDEVQGGEAGDAERVIPDDFYYDYDDMASKPFSTEGIPNQLISFHHSFGFECTKRSNLHVIDEDIALFSAGNMVELLNLKTREQKYLRTTGGGGIGAIAVHPSRKYFAVAEKGIKPDINIFEYPSLKLYRVLRDGTEEAYANLDFSPDGSMLASVGSSPDFMLTVWDWIKEKVLLRSKAFSQDVYKVAFSPDNEGHLCTSGSGHIRFWEMANTFTGLKLQGLIGKFGAKEISDIEGFVELPDGKVLSGSEWGNMLLWDGGLIKVEISKKGKKTCHNGTIEQFFMDEGELVTIGMDGFVKVWDFESIDNADTTEEGSLFEMDPMYELKVGADVKLMSMQKAVNSEAPIWYAQDAAGGIWKLDLSFTHTSHAPERLFSFHAGHITGLDTSPVAHLVATTGEDYTVRVYDYLSKKQMCQSRYSTGGTSLLWVPKSVDSNGTKILAGFNDGVVRLLTLNKVDPSQVRSKKSKSNYKLSLTQVFKPHTKPVTVMTIDKEGELLATGSNDCTVFFFSIGETYKPIGFVETASPVKSIEWSKKGKKGKSLLVSCKDGTVLEVEAPDPGEHDTSKTFHLPLTNLKITEFLFKSVKDKLRKAEEAERKAKEEEEKRKKKEAEQARRRARGLEDEEEEEEEEETKEGEGEEEEEQDKQQEERQPSEIIKSFYYGPDKNKFWLSMDGWDAGYLYECDFEEKPSSKDDDTTGEPVKSLPVPNSNDTPIRSVYLTNSGRFLMFGMDDGQIRIHPVEPGKDLESLSNYWSFTIHDNHNGSVWQLRTSFDDKYVFSVGAEGNFFAHQFMDSAVKGLKLPSKVSLPSPKKIIGEDGQEIEKKVDDIDDPNFYSIELEKQKAEHDRMVKLAEEKKQKVRRKIAELRRTFKQLMNRNQDLPGHVQLATEEFIIDPEIRKELESHTQEKIDLVHREMSWESEKHAIGLRKLKNRFKDELECERIVLIAFLTEHQVSSFRKSKPDYLQQLLQDAEGPTSKTAEGGEGVGGKKATSTFRAAQMKRQSTVDKLMGQQKQQQQPGGGQSQLGGKVAKALEKAEARRQKRLARQAQWDDLNRNKPDENYEDPSDKAAIKNAREHMGDYKLKTAKDYVVPESQRVNAAKKRVQLLKLLDQIHYYKLNFNQKFLALRNKKMAVIKEAKEAVKKLEMIQKKLDFHSRRPIPKVPSMRPEECPEKRLEYTRDQLLEFKKEKDEKDKQGGGHDDGGGGGGGFGGFGGFGGGESKLGAGKSRDRSISSVSVHSSGRPKSSLSGVTEKGTPEPTLEEVPEEPSPLEQELQYEERIRLSYEQDVLVDHINSMLRKFDADLRTLRHEKMNTEVGLKCADLRQVTLFEEFVLLKDFEKRENIYANKVNTRLEEKEDMQDKVEDCQLKLDTKKQDIEKLQDQEKALHTTFATTLGENNKFENFLTKVFKKKIKRAKKKTQTEEGSDEDSEDENSDDDFSSSDEEDSDAEELDDSVCPPGCDQALFDHVCQLRERRLDLEEELAEEKKTSESLKKELDALVKKAKVIDSALKTAEADLEAFQREKQQKLNELDVVVVLRLHQVQHMINGSIPHDLSNCLVFGGAGLINLQSRIKELEKEKHEQKRLYREHRQTHVQLIRDKKVMESRIDELEEKVRNMMMLKFGRLVDLEKLETVTVNRTVEELKEKLRQAESESARDVAKWDSKIESYKQKSTQLTRENTQRLDTFTVLLQEKKELEHMLDSRQKSLGTEFTGARKADLRERQRLVQLVQLQAQEIDALKDEITLLSRKGGHILPPAQPPLPPGQTPIPNQ
ncbi:cilia- and flagella-associated protein 44-like isoform X2 [Nematostella vectensis]|uniref:cilia- and flagella-associated protein 44-like isoform X2 n=1 Tax=Nematostella vectensis TaxID=45351 RepID=UPI0020771033|nr:cilia- and flagella-associated protein 44-like isoform X2 [Nematostella vectensis]